MVSGFIFSPFNIYTVQRKKKQRKEKKILPLDNPYPYRKEKKQRNKEKTNFVSLNNFCPKYCPVGQ